MSERVVPAGAADGGPPSTDEAPARDVLEAGDDPVARARRRAVRIGAASLFSLAVLAGLAFVTGPLHVWSGRTVRVDFTFAGPIKPGASVRVAGVVVGTVQRVDLLAGTDPEADADKMVRVTARVEDRALPVLTDAARFYVTTLGVLGEHYLDLEPGAGGEPLADGARVDGVTLARADLLLPRAAGLLESISDLAPTSAEGRELARAATRLLLRLDDAIARGETNELTAAIEDVRTVLRGAAVAIGDGDDLKRALSRLPGALAHVDGVAAKLDGALAETDAAALLGEARATLRRLDAVLGKLDAAPLLADPAVQEALRADLTRALVSVDALARRADRLLGTVEDRQGAAGRLFYDDAVADDLKAVLRGLREGPLRFLVGPGARDQK
jgi:phospholipid/cholesterol/gamma-HCH transport system substrate-binding protein